VVLAIAENVIRRFLIYFFLENFLYSGLRIWVLAGSLFVIWGEIWHCTKWGGWERDVLLSLASLVLLAQPANRISKIRLRVDGVEEAFASKTNKKEISYLIELIRFFLHADSSWMAG